MSSTPWYDRYEEYRARVEELKEHFERRCRELGAAPNQVLQEVWRDIIARIVHESNWQEALYLDIGRTKELADAVFEEPLTIQGPHLDMSAIVNAHKERVLQLKRQRKSVEEIAAYNLSRAHVTL